jgi:outer membrane protein OmpA-like peptidoglycan-associated protein
MGDGMLSQPSHCASVLAKLVPSLVLASAFLVGAAFAQSSTTVGARGKPEVEVNLSVLDALGPPPTEPQSGQRIILHPPKPKTNPATPAATPAKEKAATAPAAATPSTAAQVLPATASASAAAAPEKTASEVAAATAATAAAASLASSLAPAASSASTMQTAMTAPPAAAAPAATPVAAPAAIAKAAPAASTHVLFTAGAVDLSNSAKSALDAVAAWLVANEQLRVQLVAYASGNADEANQARRISLSRALAVRTYLTEHGVATTRMDVRALGNRSEGDSPDRVDIVPVDR